MLLIAELQSLKCDTCLRNTSKVCVLEPSCSPDLCVGPALFVFVLCCAPEECLAVTNGTIYCQPSSIPSSHWFTKAQDSFFFFNVGQFGSMSKRMVFILGTIRFCKIVWLIQINGFNAKLSTSLWVSVCRENNQGTVCLEYIPGGSLNI